MKVAVLGTGSAGVHHLEALQEIPGVEPIAIPIRPSRFRELEADGFQTAPDIPSAAGQGAGAAVIATDTSRHLADALAAIEMGMDILVEKPLAPDAQQARQLCQQASEMHRKIYVGCVLRFSRSLNLFSRYMEQVGCLHSVSIEARSYLPEWRPSRDYKDSYSSRAGEGGVLRDLIHEIDYAGWLFGWPGSLHGRTHNLGSLGIQSEETAMMSWDTETGCIVSIGLDYLSRTARRGIVAHGSQGDIEWDGIAGEVRLTLAGHTPKSFEGSQSLGEMFMAQDQEFVTACQGDDASTLATGDDGVRALAVCDAVRIACRKRQEVRIEYP